MRSTDKNLSKCGGHITIESTSEKGTKMVLRWPQQEVEVFTTEKADNVESVLILSNDPKMRTFLSTMVSSTSRLKVLEAKSIDEAIGLLKNKPIAAVLSDLQFSNLENELFFIELLNHHPNTVLIGCLAENDPSLLRRYRSQGVKDICTNVYTNEDLPYLLEKTFRKRDFLMAEKLLLEKFSA